MFENEFFLSPDQYFYCSFCLKPLHSVLRQVSQTVALVGITRTVCHGSNVEPPIKKDVYTGKILRTISNE